jgi:hypothetical protein
MWDLIDVFDIVFAVVEFIGRILFGGGDEDREGPRIQTLFSKSE